jgi:hypothetical protein
MDNVKVLAVVGNKKVIGRLMRERGRIEENVEKKNGSRRRG